MWKEEGGGGGRKCNKEKVKDESGREETKEGEGEEQHAHHHHHHGMNGVCWGEGEGFVSTHLAHSGRWTEKQAKTKFWD